MANWFTRAVNRVLGRGEAPVVPEPQLQPQEPQAERKGFFRRIADKVTGAERREAQQREQQAEQDRERQLAEQERQLEERERQLEERQQQAAQERERQLEERERQIEERERQLEERERAALPGQPSQEPDQAPTPERDLPKFGGGADADYQERDERAFGTDSDIERELQAAVDDFIMDRGGLDGLTMDASNWLQSPTISQPFSDYWTSGGFTADQVLAGMTNISNIQIVEGDDGDLHIEFDYEADVDGYEVRGHASCFA